MALWNVSGLVPNWKVSSLLLSPDLLHRWSQWKAVGQSLGQQEAGNSRRQGAWGACESLELMVKLQWTEQPMVLLRVLGKAGAKAQVRSLAPYGQHGPHPHSACCRWRTDFFGQGCLAPVSVCSRLVCDSRLKIAFVVSVLLPACAVIGFEVASTQQPLLHLLYAVQQLMIGSIAAGQIY